MARYVKRRWPGKLPPCVFILLMPIIPTLIIYLTAEQYITSIPKLTQAAPESISSIHPLFRHLSSNIPCQPPTILPSLSNPTFPHLPHSFRNVLKEYVSFHRSARKCLQAHGVNPKCPPVLIWTCPADYCAGTGNRFRGIYLTALLAIASKRVFLIDWTSPGLLEAALLPAAIDWTLPTELAVRPKLGKMHTLDIPRFPWFVCGENPWCSGFYSTASPAHLPLKLVLPTDATGSANVSFPTATMNLARDNFANLTQHVHTLAIETRSLPQISHFRTNPHLRKALGPEQEDWAHKTRQIDMLRAISQILFTPSDRVVQVLQDRKQMLGTEYDAVHARTGGDVGEATYKRFRKIQQSLNETASTLLNCLINAGGGKRPVFLATDGSRFKDTFARVAAEKGIRVVTSTNSVQHLGKLQKEEESVCEEFWDVFADLYVLGDAQILIGSRSSFADIAMWLGTVEEYFDNFLSSSNGRVCQDLREMPIPTILPKLKP